MTKKAWYYAGAACIAGTCALATAYAAPPAGRAAPSAAIASAIAAAPAMPAPPAYDFSSVDAAFESSAIVNGALIIGTADGNIHEYTKGNFDSDKAYAIASSSKWLTATLVMRMVEAGKLSLGDHPYPRLTYWTSDPNDTRSAVTLQQTLSLTSGFNATPITVTCVNNPVPTLQGCAQTLYNNGVTTTPGSTFSYGPAHPEIAAAVAEVAGAKSFDQLFADYVATPLGMNCTRYVLSSVSAALDLGARACNTTYLANANTWAAGGAVSSAHDYAKLLRALLAGGFISDTNNFLAPHTVGLPRGYVPASAGSMDWQYALGSWNECPYTAWNQTCADNKINSAPGAYGWLPWIDRKHGYYGLIATRIAVGEGDTKSVPIEQQLQPLILAAMGQ